MLDPSGCRDYSSKGVVNCISCVRGPVSAYGNVQERFAGVVAFSPAEQSERSAVKTEEYLDEFERQLDRVLSVLMDHSQKPPLPVITAIEGQRPGTYEINGLIATWRDLEYAKSEKDKARQLWLESESHREDSSPRAADVLKLDRVIDAALEKLSIDVPVNVGIAGAHASDQDTSERAIDDLVESLFNIKFVGASIKSRAGEDSGSLSRHHGRLAASKLFQDVFSRIDTYRGKGRAYYATAVRKEQKRLTRDFEIGDRNILGLTPKESRHLSDDDRELIRAANQTAPDIDDVTAAVALSNSENPEEILLAQEEEEEWGMGADLDQFSGQLPSDQRALLECWRAGESPTDARRRLDLPKSTETALRNRLKRWGHELRAQQAS